MYLLEIMKILKKINKKLQSKTINPGFLKKTCDIISEISCIKRDKIINYLVLTIKTIRIGNDNNL